MKIKICPKTLTIIESDSPPYFQAGTCFLNCSLYNEEEDICPVDINKIDWEEI